MNQHRIEFENLNNTRDLGSIHFSNGLKIKPGLLFRSGALSEATYADINKLSSLGITDIVDLRSSTESKESPDPFIEGAALHLHPLNYTNLKGIERDKQTKFKTLEDFASDLSQDPLSPKKHMAAQYVNYATVPYTLEMIFKFFEICLNAKGGVLWHCMGGKDRTGILAILLLEIFGATHEEISEDYLFTNVCKAEEVGREFKRLESQASNKEQLEAYRIVTDATWRAHRLYFDTFYSTVTAEYGDIKSFLRNGIGLTADMENALRAKYLV